MGKTSKAAPGKNRKSDSLAKKNAKLDAYYERIEIHGLEGLTAIRESYPAVSPLEARRLLEEAFVEAYTASKTHFERVGAIEEYVATSIFIHGLNRGKVEVRRECVALIESARKTLLTKRNLGKAGRVALKVAEIGVWFIPGGGLTKGAQVGAKAVISLLIRHREKVVKGVSIAVETINKKANESASELKLSNAARKVIDDLKKIIGPVPKAWPKG